MKKEILSHVNNPKARVAASPRRAPALSPVKKGLTAAQPGSVLRRDDISSLKEAALTVQQIRLNAQRELQIARKMRSDAQRYQQETATRARSDAQQLILNTRLATQRETEELIRQASEEMQKVLADIRMIRIMAQEELAAQRKFTDAARLRTMSLAINDDTEKTEVRKTKQVAAAVR